MTRDPDTRIDEAIDDVARAMSSHVVPNLRQPVGERLDRPAIFEWRWRPLVVATALAAIVALLVWPASDVPPLPAPPHREPASAAPAGATPPPVDTALVTRPAIATRARIEPEGPWPTLDVFVAPLDLAELTIEPIDQPTDPIAPMTLEPLDVVPLDIPELPSRR